MQELYAPPKSERKGAICCNRLSRERRPVDEEFPVLGLFRGWMLTPESYGELYKVLWEKGVQLINSPEAYLHCHHLPEWYAKIEGMTSRSVWIRGGVDIGSAALRALIVMMREP